MSDAVRLLRPVAHRLVGYALYRRMVDEAGTIRSITLHQCVASPAAPRP